MYRTVILLVMVTTLILSTSIARSTLIEVNDSRGHVIYDEVNRQYWIWDLTAFSNQNYMQQLDAVQTGYVTRAYFGLSTWHLAGYSELDALFNQSDLRQFNPTKQEDTAIPIWIGRYDLVSGPGEHYGGVYYVPFPGYDGVNSERLDSLPISDLDSLATLGAWVTASAPVPEPATILLLGAGMAGLAGARFLKRKK